MSVEAAAIFAAESYAQVNGVPSPVGPGLVLMGMAIAAGCSPRVRAELRDGYVADLPTAAEAVREWTRFIEAAHEPAAPEPVGDVVARFYQLLDTAEANDDEVVLPVGLLRAAVRLIWERGTANGAKAVAQAADNRN